MTQHIWHKFSSLQLQNDCKVIIEITTEKNMKRAHKIIIPFIALFVLLSSFNTKPAEKDPEKDKVLISVIKHMLTNGHYLPKDLDDDFSEQVYNSFIDGLDPSKRYFTQNDLQEFSVYKYLIDNHLKKNNPDLSFYHLVYGKFTEKIKTDNSFAMVFGGGQI